VRRLGAALIVLTSWPLLSPAQAAEVERGAGIYDICGACHGPQAQGTESLGAPPLAGQQRWYLLRQLRNFQLGARGGTADAEGEEMRQILAIVPAESDWRAVIDFVMGMSVPRPENQIAAQTGRGRQIYATCAACHGTAGEGNESLNAPNLSHLPGWYIAAQLHKFRKGIRGAAAADEPGRRMRTAAATLSSEKDIVAVSDYIGQVLRRTEEGDSRLSEADPSS